MTRVVAAAQLIGIALAWVLASGPILVLALLSAGYGALRGQAGRAGR